MLNVSKLLSASNVFLTVDLTFIRTRAIGIMIDVFFFYGTLGYAASKDIFMAICPRLT